MAHPIRHNPARMTIVVRQSALPLSQQHRIRLALVRQRKSRREALRARMKELGLTNTGLAKATSIDLSYISRIVNGQRMPGLETSMRLARALGWDLQHLADILIPDLTLVDREVA